MEEKEITIESTWWQNESQTDIIHLRDIEFRIIASMYESKKLFEKIINQVQSNDFTFTLNKKIYEYLVFYAQEDSFFGDDSKKTKIALNIYDIYNIHPHSIFKILDSRIKHPKNIHDWIDKHKVENLDLDIFELLDFSKKRQEIIILQNDDDKKAYATVKIEDEYGFYNAIYLNGIILEIDTTYIFHIPKELSDAFKNTFENVMSYIQIDNHEVAMQINEDAPEDVEAFYLKKNIDKIEQMEKLIQWADKYEIDHNKLPRIKGCISEYRVIEKFDECNLEDIPKEFFEIKQNSFSLNFINNKIKSLPNEIGISRCSILMLCNNEIEDFPQSVYELKELRTLCLHGNKIKSLPDDIDSFTKLKKLTFSNNPIKKLPASISNIITLKELEIENTDIDKNSLEYLQLENLEEISFDDKLLPWFLKNFHKLKNIETINLVHSDYSELDQEIIAFRLEIDTNSWMDEEDYLGNGCIKLSKKRDQLEDELDF